MFLLLGGALSALRLADRRLEFFAQRVPFVGSHAPEFFPDADLQVRMTALLLDFREHGIEGGDRGLKQQPGQDRELEAESLGMIEIEDRRLAAGDHAEEAAALDELGHRLDL